MLLLNCRRLGTAAAAAAAVAKICRGQYRLAYALNLLDAVPHCCLCVLFFFLAYLKKLARTIVVHLSLTPHLARAGLVDD